MPDNQNQDNRCDYYGVAYAGAEKKSLSVYVEQRVAYFCRSADKGKDYHGKPQIFDFHKKTPSCFVIYRAYTKGKVQPYALRSGIEDLTRTAEICTGR